MKNAYVCAAACAIGLAACLASGCKDDPAPDNHMDTTGHEFSIDGPCEPNTLVGGFDIGSREAGGFQYSVVGGSITNGVNWNNTAEIVADDGTCRLVEFSSWQCSPECTGGQICNNQEECVAFPAPMDMGTIEVDGLTTAVSIEPDTSFNYQFTDNPETEEVELENPPFTPGSQIILWAEGGPETEELFLDGMGVTPLTVENRDYTMYNDEDMVVTWNPSADTEGEVYGQFMIDQHGASKMWIYCSWDDAVGSGVVPAAFVHELYVDLLQAPMLGFATAYLFRRTVDSVAVPQGCAELRVLSQIQLDLGYIPPEFPDGGADPDPDGGV